MDVLFHILRLSCIAIFLLPSINGMAEIPPKAQACVACHGADGIGTTPLFPNLAGQHEVYLINAIKAYQDGRRVDPIMNGLAATLNDADIKAIAQYYSEQ